MNQQTIKSGLLGRAASVLLAAVLAMTVFLASPLAGGGAYADGRGGAAPAADGGNSIPDAAPYAFGSTVSGSVTDDDPHDYYRLTLPASGRVSISGTFWMKHARMSISDAGLEKVWDTDRLFWNEASKQILFGEDLDLNSGTYYLCVAQDMLEGPYSLKIDFVSAGETFVEATRGSDNTMDTANAIDLGQMYRGQISSVNDDTDFYRLTLPSSGKVSISGTFQMEKVYMHLFDSGQAEVWYAICYWNAAAQQVSIGKELYLNAGTYYFCARQAMSTGPYGFSIGFAPSGETFAEGERGSDNTMDRANAISLGATYMGQISHANDDADFYRLTLPSPGLVNISGTFQMEYVNMSILDAGAAKIWDRDRLFWNNASQRISFGEDVYLKAGAYYFCVGKAGRTGPYSFAISTVAPGRVSIAKLAAGKRSVKVTWQRPAASHGITGYEVRYREKAGKGRWKVKGVVGAKPASVTVRKLTKGKRYQFQLRPYRMVDGVKYSAQWSQAKTSGKVK